MEGITATIVMTKIDRELPNLLKEICYRSTKRIADEVLQHAFNEGTAKGDLDDEKKKTSKLAKKYDKLMEEKEQIDKNLEEALLDLKRAKKEEKKLNKKMKKLEDENHELTVKNMDLLDKIATNANTEDAEISDDDTFIDREGSRTPKEDSVQEVNDGDDPMPSSEDEAEKLNFEQEV